MIEYDCVEKPIDWPCNQRERKLNHIYDAVKNFLNEPNYLNKEVLISLINEIDPNQHDDFGMLRVDDYEVALINELYTSATVMQLFSLKVYLYKLVQETIRIFNLLQKAPVYCQNANDIDKYNQLISPLQLFYYTYKEFNYHHERTFCEELLNIVDINEHSLKQNNTSLETIEKALTYFMFDISNASGVNTLSIFNFNKKELLKLFQKQFTLIKKLNKRPIERPLKGVLKMTISNWILRLRNNYNHSPVFKCLKNSASQASVKNKEIWIHNIKLLNDKREGKVINELFNHKEWINFDWAKKIKLNNPYQFYVTSFSKIYPDECLKHKYGKNIYGYHTDKISNIISPIIDNNGVPQFSQVLSFDIIYNRGDATKELNFLFEIIDNLPINEEEKIGFANEIISYWFFSFKDKKWENEQERRYQIFFYENYNYFDLKNDDEYLKISSSIFLFPDLISKDNNCFDYIKANIFDRYKAIETREFIQCNDCLNIDFEIFGIDKYVCPICKSNNFSRIDPLNL